MITAFGNNGKTLVHQLLQKKGLRTWKIDFKKLNDPKLSFKDIDFFLGWVIANNPYTTIYIDDLDALCSKI